MSFYLSLMSGLPLKKDMGFVNTYFVTFFAAFLRVVYWSYNLSMEKCTMVKTLRIYSFEINDQDGVVILIRNDVYDE